MTDEPMITKIGFGPFGEARFSPYLDCKPSYMSGMAHRMHGFLTLWFLLAMHAVAAKSFREARIGTQTWMQENLNVDRFRNGDPIPQLRSPEEWGDAIKHKKPGYCYLYNNPGYGPKYGRFYNWWAVIDPRGLAPEGWHVPDDDEWNTLTQFLGGPYVSPKRLKNTDEQTWGRGTAGTNESGFTGQAAGLRGSRAKDYFLFGMGVWWCTTEVDYFVTAARQLRSQGGFVRVSEGLAKNMTMLDWGLSVRCVKDTL